MIDPYRLPHVTFLNLMGSVNIQMMSMIISVRLKPIYMRITANSLHCTVIYCMKLNIYCINTL